MIGQVNALAHRAEQKWLDEGLLQALTQGGGAHLHRWPGTVRDTRTGADDGATAEKGLSANMATGGRRASPDTKDIMATAATTPNMKDTNDAQQPRYVQANKSNLNRSAYDDPDFSIRVRILHTS